MHFNSNQEKFIFYNIPTTLFSIIPLLLITGPFLSDLSVSMIGLLFLIYCIKNKNFTYFKNKYFYFFLFFWGYLVLNSIINDYSFESLSSSLVYIRHGIFVVAIVSLLNSNEKFIKFFYYCIFFCFTVLIFDGFYQYFNGINILGWEMSSINSSRVSSFFGDELILGSYLTRLWPIFFGLTIFMFKQKNKFFYLFIIIFILSEVLIFLSGDRAAFFYINLSAVFVIILSQKLLKLRLFTLVCSILLISIISFINPTAKERVFDKTIKDMNLLSVENEEKVYIFTKTHHEIYTASYKMFMDNKIFGVGVKNFRKMCKDPDYYVDEREICFTHPHNTYIQLLSETGILGFLFLLVVIYYFCTTIFKHIILKFKGKYYFNDFEICVLSAVVIYLWPFIPTGNFFTNWLSIAMFLNLPFLIWSRESGKNINK